jgi:hypothetical protein
MLLPRFLGVEDVLPSHPRRAGKIHPEDLIKRKKTDMTT